MEWLFSLVGSAIPVILALIYGARRFGQLEGRVTGLSSQISGAEGGLSDQTSEVQRVLKDYSKETNESLNVLREKLETMHVDLAQRLGRLEGAAWGHMRPGGEPEAGKEAAG